MRELLLTYKHEAHITPSVSFSVIPKACKTGSVAFRWTSAISLFCFGFFIYLLGLWMSYIAWKYTNLHCLNIWMFTELSYRGETFGWKLNRDLYDEILPCRYCFFFLAHTHTDSTDRGLHFRDKADPWCQRIAHLGRKITRWSNCDGVKIVIWENCVHKHSLISNWQ